MEGRVRWTTTGPVTNAVEARGLIKRFGDFTAVDGLDLTIPTGSFCPFLGPGFVG
jgi:ABC-2 type transport system ATP-binding protein